jgi:hypothetical protein
LGEGFIQAGDVVRLLGRVDVAWPHVPRSPAAFAAMRGPATSSRRSPAWQWIGRSRGTFFTRRDSCVLIFAYPVLTLLMLKPMQEPTAKKQDEVFGRLVKVGLQDPFIRAIAGIVAIAVAASFAISALGNGTKTVITLALSLAFGVILVILRTIMKYVDSTFVRVACFVSCGVIMFVFLVFAVFLLPAAFICWPPTYAQLLNLPNCSSVAAPIDEPFKPEPPAGTAITFVPDNNKYLVLVFYRLERKKDAERIVGALLSAGYRSDGSQSSLNEVIAPNRNPGTTLIKTSTLARPAVDDVSRVVRIAIPVVASGISVFPDDAPLQRGNIQISLF